MAPSSSGFPLPEPAPEVAARVPGATPARRVRPAARTAAARELRPMGGLGDSLLCGLQGYDVRPELSVHAHLCRALGQPVRVPRLEWDVEPFSVACGLEAGSSRLDRLLERLSSGEIELRVDIPREPSLLYAAPGFSFGAFARCHEESAELPLHLRRLSRPFLNPGGGPSASFLHRIVAAPRASSYLVWLGGVEWMTCLLSAVKRPRAISQAMIRQARGLVRRLRAAHREHRLRRPLFVFLAAVSPVRLPLIEPDDGGGWRMAFKGSAEAGHECDRVSADEAREIARGVGRFNEALRELARREDGVFVDVDGRFGRLQEMGGVRTPGGFVPARDIFSHDLVHPNATGHALVAGWVAEELRRRFGTRLRTPDVEAVWRMERSSAPPLRAETWRRVMTVLYESYLYR